MKTEAFKQLLKYGIVGVLNTLITAIIIWVVLKFIYGVSDDKDASSSTMSVANICGYTAGLINSFIFNRNWTFKSKVSWKSGLLKFVLGFAICYLIQLGVVLWLNESNLTPSIHLGWVNNGYTISSAYICQLSGIVVYTLLNFFFNKYYTFRAR